MIKYWAKSEPIKTNKPRSCIETLLAKSEQFQIPVGWQNIEPEMNYALVKEEGGGPYLFSKSKWITQWKFREFPAIAALDNKILKVTN